MQLFLDGFAETLRPDEYAVMCPRRGQLAWR